MHSSATNRAPHRLEHLARQPRPVLERPPVRIAPAVEAREEARERVGVGHVELDPVEAARPGPHRGLRVVARDAGDVVEREHIDRLPVAAPRDLQEMDDLGDHLARRRAVHPRGQIGEPGHERVRRDAQERAAARRVHGHRLDDDQAWLAAREAHVAIPDVVVDDAVLAREARDHGRQHDAVRQRQGADAQGREERHAPSLTSAAPMMRRWISLVPS
jgi:hypothetical protein